MQYIVSRETVDTALDLISHLVMSHADGEDERFNDEVAQLRQLLNQANLRRRPDLPDPHPIDVWGPGVWLIKREAGDNRVELLMTPYAWENSDQAELAKVQAVVQEHEKERRIGYGASLDKRISAIIRGYQDTAARGLSGAKSARDNMLTWLRAMALIAEMTENAGTHSEKNARLRGMIEMCETAIKRLSQMEFDFSKSWWDWNDVFRSDYPVRHYMQRAHEAEREAEQLRERVAQLEEAATAAEYGKNGPWDTDAKDADETF